MKVISFVTQKGGSGKTTLAINCAVAAVRTKKKVLIVDMDAQGTAESWYQDREDESPQLVKITGKDLEKALDLAETQKFDWVLIDTPGRDEPAQAAAIRASDFCVIPCRPSPADMKATPPTADTIRRLGKTASFVLTQTPPRSFRIREAEKGLSVLGTVCPIPIVLRTAYQDAQGSGLGVIEFEPNGRAAKEISELWQWIVKKTGKVNYGKETNIA
jgi:chromosome partitioning protein